MRLTNFPKLQKIIDTIQKELGTGQSLYLVGGCVRDSILNLEFNDLDFVMPDDPTRFARAVAKQLQSGFFVLDDERCTARIVYTSDSGETFPLDFVRFTGNSLEEDLLNRDFTINAMAISIHDLSTIIDPLGGQADLEQRCLRLCNPNALIADPVRVLRGIRLACQFNLDFSNGLDRKIKEAAQLLPNTSSERHRDEFFKILDGQNPAGGLEFFRKFQIFNVLIPSLVEQNGIPASPPHVLPLFDHTLAVVHYLDQILVAIRDIASCVGHQPLWFEKLVDMLAPFALQLNGFFHEEITPGRTKRSLLMLGSLLHDLGKPRTMRLGQDGRLHYFNHAQVGADLAYNVSKRLKLSNAECDWVTCLVRYHMELLPFINDETMATPRAIFRFFKKVEEVGLAIILHTMADTLGTFGEALSVEKWKKTINVMENFLSAWWLQKDLLISPTPLLNGHDIQTLFGLEQGAQIGHLLNQLLEAQVNGEVQTQMEAETFLSKIVK